MAPRFDSRRISGSAHVEFTVASKERDSLFVSEESIL
jgi:hypothetical protein